MLLDERKVLSWFPASLPQTSWWADGVTGTVILIIEQHLFESKVDFPEGAGTDFSVWGWKTNVGP